MNSVSRPRFVTPIRLAVKWAWRGALLLVGLMALVWTGALLIGSCRLEAKLEEFRKDPQYANLVPKEWSKGGPGENAAPYFSAGFALLSFPDSREVVLPINDVLAGKWEGMPEESRKVVTDWIAGNEAAFNLVRAGADRPWCRFYRSWKDGMKPVPRARANEMGWIFNMEWFLISRAWVKASQGAHLEARDTIRVALSVADCLKDDPGLESQFTRLSAHTMVLGNLLKLIPAESTQAELDEWLKIVPAPDHFDESLDRAVRWETLCLVELLSSPLGRFWAEWGDHIPSHRKYEKALQRRLADPLVKWDGVRALDDLKQILRIVRMPYKDAKEEIPRLLRVRKSGMNPVRSNFVFPPGHYLESLQNVRAHCVVLRTGIAWEKYRLSTGRYPDTCDVTDPYSGAPLELKSDPLRISSVGDVRLVIHGNYSGPPAWILRGK